MGTQRMTDTPFNPAAHAHLLASGFKHTHRPTHSHPRYDCDDYRCSEYGLSIWRDGEASIWLDDHHLRRIKRGTLVPAAWWPAGLAPVVRSA